MARLVFISPYMKGEQSSSDLTRLVSYIATREGAEMLRDENSGLPATGKQRELIRQLVKDFPQSKEMLEYEDFRKSGTRGDASEFISLALEQNVDQLDRRESYLEYISHRPGVQLWGEHGLFNSDGKVPVLSEAVEEVANHAGNVWTPIVSLRREDAERLGYTNAANWQSLINSLLPELAQGYKIPLDDLRWYGAFHNKDKHVHVHLIIYSADPNEGYLTKQGIRDVKSAFARRIFRQELISVYQRQTEYRDTLGKTAEEMMAELIKQMHTGTVDNPRLEQLTADLAEQLRHTKGKKVYGYLPPRVKIIVDAIVDDLAKDERVAKAYELWQEMRDEVCRTYSDTLPERLPLSAQKEFKQVRNMVIREVLKLNDASLTFEIPEIGEAQISEEAASTADYVQYHLGKKLLDNGNIPKAVEHLTVSAEAGNQYAQYALGRLCLMGKYVPMDKDLAVYWLTLSAAQGNEYAQFFVDRLNQSRDPSVALAVLGMFYHMGRIFADNSVSGSAGNGMQIDRKRMRKLREKKIAAGHKPDDHEDHIQQQM